MREFIITEDKANAILEYLKTKPFIEVVNLVQILVELSPVQTTPTLVENPMQKVQKPVRRAPLKSTKAATPETPPLANA